MSWWESIVRVTYSLTNQTFYGTGVFVGPQTVLTAAHNVWPEALGGRPAVERLTVLTTAGPRSARGYRVHQLWESMRDPSADVAVIGISENAATGLPVRLSTPGAPMVADAGLLGFGPSVSGAGFQSPTAEYQTGVVFQSRAQSGLDSLLSRDFFVKHGFSGAPFLARTPQGVDVIGIATYELETTGQYAHKGLPMLPANYSVLLT
jgi:V8-like Glu-specific endopeptidase